MYSLIILASKKKNLLLVPHIPHCSAKRTPLINIQTSAMLSTRHTGNKLFLTNNHPETNHLTHATIHHCKYASKCFCLYFSPSKYTQHQHLQLYHFFCAVKLYDIPVTHGIMHLKHIGVFR